MPRHLVLPALLASSALACASPGPDASASSPGPEQHVYAEREGRPLRVEVVRPRSPGPHPGVLVLHPGGWTGGAPRLMGSIARQFADRGFVALAPEYRLAPRDRFPAQIDDVRDALRWARRHGGELDLDPERIGVYGYSAGGHLAALLAFDSAPDTRVQVAALGGAPIDLVALGPNPKTRALLGGDADATGTAYEEASPLAHVSADDPPTLVYHGRLDRMVPFSQARSLAQKLRANRVPTRVRTSWLGHFASFLFRGGGVDHATEFFDAWLRDGEKLTATRVRAASTESWLQTASRLLGR